MTVPSLLFGILVSSLMGAAMHLLFGGSLGKLVLYIFLSWLGFWSGHFLGSQLDWTFFSIGPLRLGTALLGSAILLSLGYWLTPRQTEKE